MYWEGCCTAHSTECAWNPHRVSHCLSHWSLDKVFADACLVSLPLALLSSDETMPGLLSAAVLHLLASSPRRFEPVPSSRNSPLVQTIDADVVVVVVVVAKCQRIHASAVRPMETKHWTGRRRQKLRDMCRIVSVACLWIRTLYALKFTFWVEE